MKCFILIISCILIGVHGIDGKCGNDLVWRLNKEEKTLTISGSGPMYDYNYGLFRNEPLPWEEYKHFIVTINIEFGVTSIGKSAFRLCDRLENVNFGSSVMSIGAYAFEYCTRLKVLDINVESIGAYAFYGCESLTNVTFGERVAQIGNHAFFGCSKFKYLKFNNEPRLLQSCTSPFDHRIQTDSDSYIVVCTGSYESIWSALYRDIGEKIKTMIIPDVNSEHYSVNNIKIQKFKIGKNYFSMEDWRTVTIALESIDARVTLDWHYEIGGGKIFHISDGGDADLKTHDAHVIVTVRFGFDTQAFMPTIKVIKTDFDIGELNIHVGGGITAVIANLVLIFLNQDIRDVTNEVMSSLVSSSVDEFFASEQALVRIIFIAVVSIFCLILTLFIYCSCFTKRSLQNPGVGNRVGTGLS